MKFHLSALFISKETQRVILSDRRLLLALAATSLFWMTGGVVYPPAVNDLGRLQFGLEEGPTGLLAACTGVGIAVGCVIAGVLSRNRFRGGLVMIGSGGMLAGLILLGMPGNAAHGTLLGVAGSAMALIGLGLSAGFFNVPLQVLLQAKTPSRHKGRVIGAMNLVNWIGIGLSGLYYHVLNQLFTDWKIPCNAMFLAAAALFLPIVLFYRPRSETLTDTELAEEN